MSTKNMSCSFTRQYIPDVNDSNYQFSRFELIDFKGVISVIQLMCITNGFSTWEGASSVIFDSIREEFSFNGRSVYGFIVSPCWKKDTRINRYFGLSKSLSKDFGIDPLDFTFEKKIVIDNEMIFYGVIKLTSDNCMSIFNLISKYENGVLLSSENSNDLLFNSLVGKLTRLITIQPVTSSFNLNVVKAIDLITNYGNEALYPYAWEETGEYHLDIFKKNI